MPNPRGWRPPDWVSMSGEELRDHLRQMQRVGEAYQTLYASEEFPPSDDRWDAWSRYPAPNMVAWRSTSLPGQAQEMPVPPVDQLKRSMADQAPWARTWQEEVQIYPFPGGVVFEQILHIVAADGTDTAIPGVHIFFCNPDGTILRVHEYYNFPEVGVLNVDSEE